MDQHGFIVQLHITYDTGVIKDDMQYLRSDEKARCRLCGGFVTVNRVYSREAEAQHVADEIRVSLMGGETLPEKYRFTR